MHPSLPDLYQLQQIDTKIAKLEKTLATMDRGEDLKKELESIQKKAIETLGTLRSMKSEIQDLELSLKTVETKKGNYEKKIHSGQCGPKEYANFEKEIGNLTEKQGELEEKILVLMDQAETTVEESKSLQDNAATVEKEWTEKSQEAAKKSQELEEEIQKTLPLRDPIVQRIDSVLIKRYENLRKHGGLAVALVKDKSCSGCQMTLTNFSLREAQESDKIVTCENCSRILYFDKELSN